MALTATWWVMCARERGDETAEGQRCYCLTQYQQSPDERPRMCPDVHMARRRYCSGVRASMNHSHTLTPGPSCCFMASPAMVEGWQPRSVAGRGRKKREGERREGESCGLRADRGGWVSAEKERRDERQVVKQVQGGVRKAKRSRGQTRWTHSQHTASSLEGAVGKKKVHKYIPTSTTLSFGFSVWQKRAETLSVALDVPCLWELKSVLLVSF